MRLSAQPGVPATTDTIRARHRAVTAGVIAANVAVWIVFLGLLDRAAPTAGVRFVASPSADVERRPVLFAVSREASAGTGDARLIATATPIAVVEPDGDLRPPLAEAAGPEERERRSKSFVETYYPSGAALKLLRGGVDAGVLHAQSVSRAGDAPPVCRGACEGPDLSQMPAATPDFALAISDHRFGAPASGVRPMRESHRAAAERLLRQAAADRHPKGGVEEIKLVRVSAADLNHDGRAEIVASGALSVRLDAKSTLGLDVFLIAEPVGEGPAGYKIAFARIDREPEGLEPSSAGGYRYVDQVDLSPAEYDEVVVRGARAGAPAYVVLRRGAAVWAEVYPAR
jgi:hypothetical protein